MAPHHLFLWLLLLTEICTADQDRGEIGCRLPPVKKGEKATLTCSYNFKLTAGVTVTVNGQGLHIGGSDKGKDVPVLSLVYTEEGWAKPTVDQHFQLRHISDVTDGMKWTVVIDILNATEEYEGLYTCQLLLQFGSGAPGPQQCNFFLDTLNTEIKNSSSVLLRLPDHPIKKIELRKQGSAEVEKISVDPPKESYLLHDMESNTAYVIKVHVDQMDYPLTRTVCLPTVRSLATEAANASTIRVHWEASSCHTVRTAFTYHVCHKKADSVEWLHCFPSNITTVSLSDLEAETDYQIRVSVSVGEKNVGSVTQRRSTSQDKTVHDSGEEKTSVRRIVGITLGAVIACVSIVILAIVCVRKKLWTCLKRNPASQPNPPEAEAVPLNEVRADPLPLDVQEEQAADPVVEEDGPDCAEASIGGIQSAQEGPDEEYEQLKAEKDAIAEELNRSVKERQETEQKLKRKSLECLELQTQVKSLIEENEETGQKLSSKSLEGQRLQAKIKSLEDKNKTLGETCAILSCQVESKETDIRVYQQAKKDAKKELESMKIRCGKLESELSKSLEQKRDLEETKRKCADLEKEINHCEEKIKRLEREKEKTDQELGDLRAERDRLSERAEQLSKRLEQAHDDMNRERGERQELQRELSKTRRNYEEWLQKQLESQVYDKQDNMDPVDALDLTERVDVMLGAPIPDDDASFNTLV